MDTDIETWQFRAEDQAEARHLILAGLAERWGTLNLELNADLNDIGEYYRKGVFLVARRDGQLVGTGALDQTDADVSQVVRMSVAAHARRLGIGRRIFLELCRHARERGSKRVVLETTETWTDAVAFYERCGCRRTVRQDGDQFFVFDLP